MTNTISGLVQKDIHQIIKHYWKQFLGVGILVGFLLFLLNIFLGVSSYTHSFGETLKDKLGMYFYIKEDPENKSATYNDVIALQTSLQKQGLQVMFSSKEDALKFLEKKMPEVTSNFSKFGIDNPLPATLYVMFSTRDQYEVLKTTILQYKHLILNIKDLDNGTSIKQQENRILNIINLSNFITTISLIIVGFLLVIIFTFLGFLSKFLFGYFKKHIEIKQILGGSPAQTAKEFALIHLLVLGIGAVLCFGLLIVSWSVLGVSLNQLFAVGILDIFAQSSIWIVFGGFILEIAFLAVFTYIFSYLSTYRKIQKISA